MSNNTISYDSLPKHVAKTMKQNEQFNILHIMDYCGRLERQSFELAQFSGGAESAAANGDIVALKFFRDNIVGMAKYVEGLAKHASDELDKFLARGLKRDAHDFFVFNETALLEEFKDLPTIEINAAHLKPYCQPLIEYMNFIAFRRGDDAVVLKNTINPAKGGRTRNAAACPLSPISDSPTPPETAP